jgi:hypothetical protein
VVYSSYFWARFVGFSKKYGSTLFQQLSQLQVSGPSPLPLFYATHLKLYALEELHFVNEKAEA